MSDSTLLEKYNQGNTNFQVWTLTSKLEV